MNFPWTGIFQQDGYRPKDIEHSLLMRVLVFLTISIAIAATIYAAESPVWLAAVSIMASGFGTWVSWRRREAKNWWIKVILALMMLVALASFFYEIADNPFDARIPLAHLLIWLQVLHSYDLPRRKDVFYSLWVALILISVAATTSRNTGFGVFLIAYSILALLSLLAGHLSSQGLHRMGLRFWGKFSLPVLLLSIVGGAFVFVLIPRYQGLKVRTFPVSMQIQNLPFFNGEIKNPAYPNRSPAASSAKDPNKDKQREFDPYAYYGFSTELDLNYRGKLANEVVMRVRSPRAEYWRGMAFDTYDGLRWTMQKPFELKRYENSSLPIWIRQSRNLVKNIVPKDQETYTFYIERDQSNLIFSVPYVEKLYFPTNFVLIDDYGGIRSPIELFSGTTYTVVSAVPRYSEQALRTVSWDKLKQEAQSPTYTQIPQALPQRVKDLAASLTAESQNPYDAVKTLEQHLKQNYPYDLEIPTFPTNRDTIDYFLFEQKAGYCEHFASSLAVMARSLGLATRFVTGYVPGEYNPMTGYFDVRSSDAHGWVEVYFPHHGWVPFDPTPGYLANLSQGDVHAEGNLKSFFDYFLEAIPVSWKNLLKQSLGVAFGAIAGVFGLLVGAITFLPLPILVLGIGLFIVVLMAWVYWRGKATLVSTAATFQPAYASDPQKRSYVDLYQQNLNQLASHFKIELPSGKTAREQTLFLQPFLDSDDYSRLQESLGFYYLLRYGQEQIPATHINMHQKHVNDLIAQLQTKYHAEEVHT